jgi:hypothetical protein
MFLATYDLLTHSYTVTMISCKYNEKYGTLFYIYVTTVVFSDGDILVCITTTRGK